MASQKIVVPNIGDFKDVEIIEVLVKPGQKIKKNDSIITLESDKSSVEVPSTNSGKISNIKIKIGDKVSEGDTILEIITDQKESKQETPNVKGGEIKNENLIKKEEINNSSIVQQKILSSSTGASPNTLKFARELGIDINQLQGSGRGGRVKKEDIKNFIKTRNVAPTTNNVLGVIPVGNDLQRPTTLAQNGAIRFNTDSNQYEGYSSTSASWSSLGGVRDIDGNTYILAELTTGANDNTLWFYNDAINTLKLNNTFLDFRAVKSISSGKLGLPTFTDWASNVPVTLGAIHQTGAVILFLSIIIGMHRLNIKSN